jgi:cysteinyl-tRNA synthetase
LFQWIRTTNASLDANSWSPNDALATVEAWKIVDSVLGLGDSNTSVPADVQSLADQRAAARKAKDFAAGDTLRKQIEALGWKVKDTPKGQELTPA